jgi:hypothetical protein
MDGSGAVTGIHQKNHPGTDGPKIQIHALQIIVLTESMELVQVIFISFDGMDGIPFLSLQVFQKIINPGHGQHLKASQNARI